MQGEHTVYISRIILSCLQHHSPDSAAKHLVTQKPHRQVRSKHGKVWVSVARRAGLMGLICFGCWAHGYLAIRKGLVEPLTISSEFITFSKDSTTVRRWPGCLDVALRKFLLPSRVVVRSVFDKLLPTPGTLSTTKPQPRAQGIFNSTQSQLFVPFRVPQHLFFAPTNPHFGVVFR